MLNTTLAARIEFHPGKRVSVGTVTGKITNPIAGTGKVGVEHRAWRGDAPKNEKVEAPWNTTTHPERTFSYRIERKCIDSMPSSSPANARAGSQRTRAIISLIGTTCAFWSSPAR